MSLAFHIPPLVDVIDEVTIRVTRMGTCDFRQMPSLQNKLLHSL